MSISVTAGAKIRRGDVVAIGADGLAYPVPLDVRISHCAKHGGPCRESECLAEALAAIRQVQR